MPRELLKIRAISVRYGIKWIAEPAQDSDKVMALVYKNHKDHKWNELDLPLAYFMRDSFPSITKDVLIGKAKDIKIIKNGIIVLATPKRLYSEQGHDFLKSDICVIGPVSKEGEVKKQFKELIKASLTEKAKVLKYVKHILPYLDALVVKTLVIGVFGRGSYFDRNGFPDMSNSKHENINFVLFSTDSSKKTKNRIVSRLKKIPIFGVELIERREKLIKKGKHPTFNFTIVSADMTQHHKTGKYERYLLKYSPRISLPHLEKAKSDAEARKFLKILSKS